MGFVNSNPFLVKNYIYSQFDSFMEYKNFQSVILALYPRGVYYISDFERIFYEDKKS